MRMSAAVLCALVLALAACDRGSPPPAAPRARALRRPAPLAPARAGAHDLRRRRRACSATRGPKAGVDADRAGRRRHLAAPRVARRRWAPSRRPRSSRRFVADTGPTGAPRRSTSCSRRRSGPTTGPLLGRRVDGARRARTPTSTAARSGRGCTTRSPANVPWNGVVTQLLTATGPTATGGGRSARPFANDGKTAAAGGRQRRGQLDAPATSRPRRTWRARRRGRSSACRSSARSATTTRPRSGSRPTSSASPPRSCARASCRSTRARHGRRSSASRSATSTAPRRASARWATSSAR